jgi:hypothetical protein
MPYCQSCGRPLAGEGRFCAACGAPQAVAPRPLQYPVRNYSSPVSPGQAPPPAPGARRPFPGWAVALFVIIALCVIAAFAALVVPLFIVGGIVSNLESFAPSPGADVAAEVRAGVGAIQMGIEKWRADNGRGTYPPAAVVTPERLGRYVDPWPVNPCAGGPMRPGAGPGEYDYVRLSGGEGYTLIGYGGDGAPVHTAP